MLSLDTLQLLKQMVGTVNLPASLPNLVNEAVKFDRVNREIDAEIKQHVLAAEAQQKQPGATEPPKA